MKKKVVVNAFARKHGLGDGFILEKDGSVMEFRSHERGFVKLRRGRNDPYPEKMRPKDVSIWLVKLFRSGWKVRKQFVEEV